MLTKLSLNSLPWTTTDTLFTRADATWLSSSASCARWIHLPPATRTTNQLLDFRLPSFRSTKGLTRRGLQRRQTLVFRICGRSPQSRQQYEYRARALHAGKSMILPYHKLTINNSSKWQAIEYLIEKLPHRGGSILFLRLFVETIHTGYLSEWMFGYLD